MKLVLTGESELALQKRLGAVVAEASGAGQTKQDVDLRKVSPEDLTQKLGEQSLFGASTLWVIHGWQSLRSPKQADAILEQLATHPDNVVIVVPDKLTPAKKKKLTAPGSGWKIETFDPPANVFTFLEAIKLKPLDKLWPLYLQALESSGEWGLHALTARQAWMLLQYQAGEPSVSANPWMAKKLAGQAKVIPRQQLLTFINDLYSIEFGIKSGKNKLPWREQFDVSLAKLYALPVVGKS
jgi:DNA polymerase III delta subunit